MWIENNGARKRYRKSENVPYMKLNLEDGNPAVRVSEKGFQDLGWKDGDYVNIYVDSEKMILVRDNENQSFSIHQQKGTDGKSYGFCIYGKVLKEAFKKGKWVSKRTYTVNVLKNNNGERILVCYREDKAIRKPNLFQFDLA